jgi:ubiquinone/menaquinone biosynthesis C-methylase UbiE
MSLRASYTLIAPVYDIFIERVMRAARARSLAPLGTLPGTRILIPGIGTGLDLPHLPPGPRYVGLDLTAAMIRRAGRRLRGPDVVLVQGDAMRLPFPDSAFDAIVLHLILAVVPSPDRLLAETARVVRTGGEVFIFDKFLRAGRPAPLRRAISLVSRHIATRTDVVFEHVLAAAPSLRVVSDEPALAGGWFRFVRLVKAQAPQR